MSDVTLLHPAFLLLALLIPLLVVVARRLTDLARWRRRTAVVLQSLSALLLIGALAEPMRSPPGTALDLVLVLDASDSLSDAARAQALAFTREVLAGARPGDRVQVVATAGPATVLSSADIASGLWRGAGPLAAAGGSRASNLAAGLRLAGSLLPDIGRRRVVLLSDGWETQGQATDEAARLTARGIDLAVVALPALGRPEALIAGLDTPAGARVGDTVASTVRVYSTDAATGTLQISVDGTALLTRTVVLQAGDNVLPLEQHAAQPGFHRLDVTLAGVPDTRPENNTASAALMVDPAPHVLILEDRAGEAAPLAQALQDQQLTVTVEAPSTIPAQAAGLAAYDAVILDNVAATSLTLDQQRTLQEFVRTEGRGLVVLGGATSFARGGYVDSVLEQVLPLSSRPGPRPAQGATALILLIDRSDSMAAITNVDDSNTPVSSLAMALSAAQLATDALRPGDTIGVLTFDTANTWTVPITTIAGAGDKARIKAQIATIRSGGGTNIYNAVVSGTLAMRGLAAPTKHIVLLTDGRDGSTGNYDPVLAQLRATGASLTAIGIGHDVDQRLLTELATTGQGRYYFTERPSTIPQIIVKDVDVSLKQDFVEGAFQARAGVASPLMQGFSLPDLPGFGGYDLTQPKDSAVLALATSAGDPLLAHWNYGLGRVVAFTSGANPTWGAPWLGWADFGRFWDQAVRWTLAGPGDRRLQPTITVTAPTDPTTAAGLAHLTVESLRADNTFADLAPPTVGLRAPSGVVTSTLLTQTGPGHYEADVPLAEVGPYEVRVLRAEGTGVLSTTTGFSVPPSPELLHAGVNDRLLKRLAHGQDYVTQAGQALDPRGLPPAPPELQPLWPPLLALALLLALASVAVRRVDFRFARS